MSLVTGIFFLVILLNQQWFPTLRLQASHCSTFRIMCDVPSIAVFVVNLSNVFLVTTVYIIIILTVYIIIIIIIIIILGISFMQGIYTYIPETNHIPREHRVATILM